MYLQRILVLSTVTQQARWNSGFSAHWVCFMGGLVQRLGCVQMLLLLLWFLVSSGYRNLRA